MYSRDIFCHIGVWLRAFHFIGLLCLGHLLTSGAVRSFPHVDRFYDVPCFGFIWRFSYGAISLLLCPHVSPQLGVSSKWLTRRRPTFWAGMFDRWRSVYFPLHHARRQRMPNRCTINDDKFGCWVKVMTASPPPCTAMLSPRWLRWPVGDCWGSTWTSSSPSAFHVWFLASTADARLKHLFH